MPLSSSAGIFGIFVRSPGSARLGSRAGRWQHSQRVHTRDRTVRRFFGKIAAWHCQMLAPIVLLTNTGSATSASASWTTVWAN